MLTCMTLRFARFFGMILVMIVVLLQASFFAREASAVFTDDVTRFESKVVLNKNASLEITETISYETALQKHGIYRTIPFRVENNGRVVTTEIENVSVRNEDGTRIPFSQSRKGGTLILKIGDADKTFTGASTYLISYTVHRPLQVSENNLELIWDIVGEGWTIPVHETSATILSPHATITQATCVSGPIGQDDGRCQLTKTNESITLRYDKEITSGSNITVLLNFSPENTLTLPTRSTVIWWMIRDNLWVLYLLLPPIAGVFLWWMHGRDREYRDGNIFSTAARSTQSRAFFSPTSSMVVEPLKVSPGMAGLILDESYGQEDLVADIVDLASKKFIEIRQTREKGWFVTAEYEFTQLHEKKAGLPLHQQEILNALFQSGERVLLSELKKTFYRSMDGIRRAAFIEATRSGFFVQNPQGVRNKSIITLILIAVSIGFGLRFVSAPILVGMSSIAILVGALISVAITLLTFLNLTQKTAVGTLLWHQARGLRSSLKRGAWREAIKEKHHFFEEMLPFAIAFGVVNQLNRAMQSLGVPPPDYIHGINSASLASGSFFQDFSSQVGSSLAVSPSSSSAGGGGSGGGGGGGGGGSW